MKDSQITIATLLLAGTTMILGYQISLDKGNPNQLLIRNVHYRASDQEALSALQTLLEKNPDVNINSQVTPDFIEVRSTRLGYDNPILLQGRTALMLAARKPKLIKTLTFLLSRGANKNIRDINNQTALDLAKEAKNQAAIETLQ